MASMNLCAELLLVHPGDRLWPQCRVTSCPRSPRAKDLLGSETCSTCLEVSWSPSNNSYLNLVLNLPFSLQFRL